LAELVRIGGLNIQDTTGRVLTHVISQALAEVTSKTGKGEGNQYGFIRFKFSSLIIGRALK